MWCARLSSCQAGMTGSLRGRNPANTNPAERLTCSLGPAPWSPSAKTYSVPVLQGEDVITALTPAVHANQEVHHQPIHLRRVLPARSSAQRPAAAPCSKDSERSCPGCQRMAWRTLPRRRTFLRHITSAAAVCARSETALLPEISCRRYQFNPPRKPVREYSSA